MATLPGSQTTIQVDPSQTLPATPVGNVSSGQRLHVAAALPTGCPQSPFLQVPLTRHLYTWVVPRPKQFQLYEKAFYVLFMVSRSGSL